MLSYLKGASTHGLSSTSYNNSNQGTPSQILICILHTLKGKLPIHWQTATFSIIWQTTKVHRSQNIFLKNSLCIHNNAIIFYSKIDLLF